MALIFTPSSEIHLDVDGAASAMALYDFYQGKGKKDIHVAWSDVKNANIPYSFYNILKKYPRKIQFEMIILFLLILLIKDIYRKFACLILIRL